MYHPQITDIRSWNKQKRPDHTAICSTEYYKGLKYFWTSSGFSHMISTHFIELVLGKGLLQFSELDFSENHHNSRNSNRVEGKAL